MRKSKCKQCRNLPEGEVVKGHNHEEPVVEAVETEEDMSNYKKHFDRELAILQADPKITDDNKLLIHDFIPEIYSIIKKFGKQGHSGGSAPFYANTLGSTIKQVLLFQTLSPLTGQDDEWNDTGETLNKSEKNEMYQNNRRSSVFKNGKDGQAYYIDAIVFSGEEEHDTFTGSVEGISSKQFIKEFPFTPKTFYIDVYKDFEIDKYPENEVVDCGENNKYVYRLKDIKQLDEVFAYYDKK